MRPKDQALMGKTEGEKLTVFMPKLCGLRGALLPSIPKVVLHTTAKHAIFDSCYSHVSFSQQSLQDCCGLGFRISPKVTL